MARQRSRLCKSNKKVKPSVTGHQNDILFMNKALSLNIRFIVTACIWYGQVYLGVISGLGDIS